MNIVLCSDGTGNSGGKERGTNVWNLYNAIDRRTVAPNPRQIAFHVDGVGTQTFKPIRALSGATGMGITRNVGALYKYLVRNHQQGCQVYLFGFSRGAYTVRVLASLIAHCGILDHAMYPTEAALDDAVRRVIKYYKTRPIAIPANTVWYVRWLRHARNSLKSVQRSLVSKAAPMNFLPPQATEIHFMGVWDTVSAIGIPFDCGLKQLIEFFWGFSFHDNVLNAKTRFGCHALALDDERRTFHPEPWCPAPNVEQVWFAGVHSNVGGGYPRDGVARTALEWMMDHAAANGLLFDRLAHDQVRLEANVFDRFYDSRASLAAYYRYAPRRAGELSKKFGIDFKVHVSVLERIKHGRPNYNPGGFVTQQPITVVGPAGDVTAKFITQLAEVQANALAEEPRAAFWVRWRQAIQLLFFVLTGILGVFYVLAQFWQTLRTPPEWGQKLLSEPIRSAFGWLDSYLPAFAEGTLLRFVETYPEAMFAIPLMLAMHWQRTWIKERLEGLYERVCMPIR